MATPVLAAVGDVPFNVHVDAADGSYRCGLLGSYTAFPDVDPTTVDTTGDIVATASNLELRVCNSLLNPSGTLLYHVGSANDEAIAEDTLVEDFGEGKSTLTNVSLLGVVTYQEKVEDDRCDETTGVECTGNATITGLTFGGVPITGSLDERTVYPAINLSVPSPACGLGAGLFTGELVLNDVVNSTEDQSTTFIPIALNGRLTCVGLPLAVVDVKIRDTSAFRYNLLFSIGDPSMHMLLL